MGQALRSVLLLGSAAVFAGLAPRVATAQVAHPVAIVEEASAGAALSAFEYLAEGQRIDLSGGAEIVIGYFSSCRVERVSGGTLTVGRDSSVVTGGDIRAETVDCHGGPIELSPEAAAQSGVAIYRAPHEEDLVLYSATPAFAVAGLPGEGAIEVERLDRPEPVRRFPLDGGVADLVSGEPPLKPGGLYEARHGDLRRTFRIVVYARPGGPLLSRLVAF